MNETLQKIMEFINNNTLLLIGICVFLILVLIGYLIDNSVKSKRVRNDIKNADQVPESIKNEIIKEAEEAKEIVMPEVVPEVEATPEVENNVEIPQEAIKEEPQTNIILDATPVDDNSNVNQELIFDGLNTNIDSPVDLDKTANNLSLELPSDNVAPVQEFNFDISSAPSDPDVNIMMPTVDNEYRNDRKLSDILMGINDAQTNVIDNNIFSSNPSDIVINNDVQKDEIQIENNETSDELDKIMSKLSSYSDDSQEDNYTNIF